MPPPSAGTSCGLSLDGKLTPGQLAAGARGGAGFHRDHGAQHNTSGTHGAWRADARRDLLVILGQEVTTPTVHWLALGIRPGQVVDWRYTARDLAIAEHVGQVHQAGGL